MKGRRKGYGNRGKYFQLKCADQVLARRSTVTPGMSKSQPLSSRTYPSTPHSLRCPPSKASVPPKWLWWWSQDLPAERIPQAQLPPAHQGLHCQPPTFLESPPSKGPLLSHSRGPTSVSCQAPGAPSGGDWEASWVLDPFPTASPKPSAWHVQPPTVTKFPPLLQPCTPEPPTFNILLTSAQPLPLALGSHPRQGSLPSCFGAPILPAGPLLGSPALCSALAQVYAPSRPGRWTAPGGRNPAAQLWTLAPGPGCEAGQVLKTVPSPPKELPWVSRSFPAGLVT